MATTDSMLRPTFSDHISAHFKPRRILSTSSTRYKTAPSGSSSSRSDRMDMTSAATTSFMLPPPSSSPSTEGHHDRLASTHSDPPLPSSSGADATTAGQASIGAAVAASQPKVVQTAFIHKLYSMLEDQSIQHLISWSNSKDSFIMSPSQEFAKALAQYFKHTNISSFVRQLNMYGFHKISDVFHNGPPDSAIWEFRHGNNSFKRGDIHGLREIKRRASRHTLMNRDTFPAMPNSQASTQPTTGTPDMQHDTLEARMANMEHYYVDMHTRLVRSEDQLRHMTTKYITMYQGLLRCYQWNQDLAIYLTSTLFDQDSQRDMIRQADILRAGESPDLTSQDSHNTHPLPQFPFTVNHVHDLGTPLSPRQMPGVDPTQRRPSQPTILEQRTQQSSLSTSIVPRLSISPRRHGSIDSRNSTFSPNPARALQPPPPTMPLPVVQHPLATVTSPPTNLPRRHTSADIRTNYWQATGPPITSTFAGAQLPGPWPQSPAHSPLSNLALREGLANYEIPHGPSSQSKTPPREALDPFAAIVGTGPDSAWSIPGRAPTFPKALSAGLGTSEPLARRSSMASNLHGLLNPPGEFLAEGSDSIDNSAFKRKRIS